MGGDILIEVDNGIFLLQGKKSSNIYFIQQKDGIIIDTGHPHQATENLRALKDFGLTANDVKYIINTHSHPDHVGGNIHFLNYFSEAKIISSIRTQRYLEKKRQYALYDDIEDIAESSPIHIKVKDGDCFNIDNRNIRFLETPGHTGDSISIELDNNILFSGDTLYQNIVPQVDYYDDLLFSLSVLDKTYERLAARDCKKIFPGHGIPFDNSEKVFAMLRRKIKRFTDNPLLLLVNTVCPLLELYIKKVPGKTMSEVLVVFDEYLHRPVSVNLWPTFNDTDFSDSIEKALFLMKTMNMIIIDDDGRIFLSGELNEHL